MCYAKPGARCSPHMYANLMSARRAVKRRPHSKERREELARAREAFLTSPRGIEALRTGKVETGTEVDADGNTVKTYLPASNFGIQQDAAEADLRQAERDQMLEGMREALADEDKPTRSQGRPELPKAQKLSEVVEPTFTPYEKNELKKMADAEGMTVSELVRSRLDEEEDTSDYESTGNQIISVIDSTGGKSRHGNNPKAKVALKEKRLFDMPMTGSGVGRKSTAGGDEKRTKYEVKDGKAHARSTGRVRVNVSEETLDDVERRADALNITKNDYLRRKVLYGNAGRLENHQGSGKMRAQAVGMVNVAKHGWDWKVRQQQEELELAA